MAYASKYYDPVKAHEYYIKHRQLKGTTRSTAGMTDEQKSALKYIKENLQAEKKQAIADAKATLDSQIKTLRETVSTWAKKMQEKRSAELKKAKTKEEKAKIREKYKTEIAKVKSDMKQQISDARTKQKEWKAQMKTEYENRYNDEYDKYKASLK